MPEVVYEIQCVNCQGEFPKVVVLKENENAKGARSFEVKCPHCKTLLSIETDKPIAHNSFVLRSLKKKPDAPHTCISLSLKCG